ncbi:hypothetical protein OIU83_17700 [Flavobacterium sp. LS1R49]|uniref:Uncharacterized protein n=1 Tax=Flavobacterium shii TaxID=2987687 RepID=A0A9X3BZ00_9FLAO|nr:hypothetical protein [Flavobacterium shii]MCV9929500.1 hypothetical protein [Flavobacterium shii]
MKVELKLTNYQLSFLNEMVADNLLSPSEVMSKENKSFIYLMTEIGSKLLKKAIDKRSHLKPFKVSFKYYEAFALHQFLYMYVDYVIKDYETTEQRRITREILGIINQKLA